MRAMQRKKGMIVFLLLLTLVSMCGTNVHAATNYTQKVTKKNADFTISAEYGLNGLVYYDMPTMVSITVECKENFTGTLQLIPNTDYGSTRVAYGEDIALSAGEAKTFHFTPSTIGSSGTVTVQILNDKGKVIYGEKHQIMLENGGSKVSIGILSDDYSAFSYFDGIGINVNSNQGVTTILELTKDSFPDDAMGLSMLQYMVIDNYDTANLSKEQYEALKTWVRDGGVLILGLGSNYQNVLHGFDDSFVSGTIGTLDKKNISFDALEDATAIIGLEEKEQTTETQETDGQTTEASQEQTTEAASEDDEAITLEDVTSTDVAGSTLNMDCLEFELEGGEPFSDLTTEGTAYSKEIGNGQVVVLGYSLGMEPMTSSSDKKSIAKFVIETAWVNATETKFYGSDYGNGSLYSGLEVAKLADDSRKPSALLYGFVLLVYILLVGPILYLILKAVNKREKVWVAIPLVTLVFTVIIYLTGFLYRINKPLVSTFTVVQLQNNAKTENVYTNILCPKPKEYTIQFAEGYTGFRRNNNEYSYSMFETESDITDYDYMLKSNSKGTEITLDHSEPFQSTGFVVNKGGDNNIGMLEGDITCYTTGFEGTVTNNTCYDVQDVVVTFENYICLVGDVKKGETITIDSAKVVESDAYGSFETLYASKNLYTNRDLYRKYQANNMVETNLIDKSEYHTGYIWAYVPSYKPELVDGSNVKRSGCGVLLTSFQAEYEDVQGAYYPSIDGLEIASQGDYDSQDRMIYSAEVVITYYLGDLRDITYLENMTTTTGTQYRTPAEVYAYNVNTGDYDKIFTDGTILEGAELQKYLLEDVIMLKYVPSASGYGAFIPRISARGEE